VGVELEGVLQTLDRLDGVISGQTQVLAIGAGSQGITLRGNTAKAVTSGI
jgi:hypothetical protein